MAGAWFRGRGTRQRWDRADADRPADAAPPAGEPAGQVALIPIDAIRPNPYQPRAELPDPELEDLAASIAANGLLQPVVVRKTADGYELVAGERRWRACRLLGLRQIPALIRAAEDAELAVLALIENLQRADLSYWDEAEGYRRLIEDFGWTQTRLAERVGKSQAAIANKLRLLRLDPRVRERIVAAGLSERHARALLGLDPETQLALVDQVAREGRTVQATEELVAATLAGRTAPERPRRRVVRVVKDVRIVLNTLRQAVETLRRAGLEATIDERDAGDAIEVVLRLPKGPGNR